jgi:DNA-binding NarL/FixJ family response regulator
MRLQARLAENRIALPRAVAHDSGVPRTVLVVDDNPGFRARARRWLEAEEFTVVAEACDGASALDAVRAHRPAVVLLDVQLPDVSGLDLAEQLAAAPGSPAVVLTSTRDASDFGDRVARSGARGFVPKSELSGDAVAALLA